jgi:hypothetical protein
MRVLVGLLLLSGQLMAQQLTREATNDNGTFFIDGIVYRYTAGTECTVVTAAHSVLNHKFLAVKVRIYNAAQHSISVRPEDVVVEDAVRGQAVSAVSAPELARRMRRAYNMARYAVGNGGGPTETDETMSPQLMAMMQAIAAQDNSNRMAASHTVPPQRNVLYTDTPGALEEGEANATVCDRACQLRNQEAKGTDALTQLQRQSTPESVEEYALLANTVPPRASVGGVLYYPLGKLAEGAGVAEHAKKGRLARVTVIVMGEKYQFELPVE